MITRWQSHLLGGSLSLAAIGMFTAYAMPHYIKDQKDELLDVCTDASIETAESLVVFDRVLGDYDVRPTSLVYDRNGEVVIYKFCEQNPVELYIAYTKDAK